MYEDLDRPPLNGSALARALAPDGWRVEVHDQAGSTNAVVAARADEPEGLVVVAEEQTAGRGRLDRQWLSPPRAGLTVSALLAETSPWVTLWAGVAVARTLREAAGVEAFLKWPNDVLVGGRKIAGLLAERVGTDPRGSKVVLGVGLNVSTRADELPPPAPGTSGGTSLLLSGATTLDRDTLLRALLRNLDAVMVERTATSYRALCSTIGATVSLQLPGGGAVTGTAEAVDDTGRLVVAGVAYAAGDVTHLRPG